MRSPQRIITKVTNAQIAHIYGVTPKGPRFRSDIPASVRNAFANLILLCYPHHGEVDGDEARYPSERLREWKQKHDGPELASLNSVSLPDPDDLMDLLTQIATPPLNRLEAITERLEQAGEATRETVLELKDLVDLLSSSNAGVDAQSAHNLATAAEILSSANVSQSAIRLLSAAEILPGVVQRIEEAVQRPPPM